MKVAVAATGPGIEDFVPREFDQSRYLVIVDTTMMAHEAVISPMRVADGLMAAKLLVRALQDASVSTVLANHVNVDVLKGFLAVLNDAGIQIIDGVHGSIRGVVTRFRDLCGAETTVMPCPNITD